MLRRVQVDSAGDAEYIPGQSIVLFDFQNKNAQVLAEGGEPATAKPVLLGVTRSSLLTDSFLAAASFQETTRVLTEAAASGGVDHLLGLKENVIIGRLIPARVHMELPAAEGQFMLGEEPRIEGPDGEPFIGPLMQDLPDPFTNGHDELENGHGDLQGQATDGLVDVNEDGAETEVDGKEMPSPSLEEEGEVSEVKERQADD